MDLEMTLFNVVAIFLLGAAGTVVQSSVGFGLALVAAPFLVLLHPVFVPGPLVLCAVLLNVFILGRDRGGLDLSQVWWAVLGRIPGAVVAGWLLVVLPASTLSVLFGVSVLLAVALSVSGLHVALTPRNLFLAGLLSGVMGTISAIGGPPMALIYQRHQTREIRGNLAAYFLLGGVVSMVVLCVTGKFGIPELRASVPLVPGLVAGYLASRRLAHALLTRNIRPALLAVATMSALLVIGKTLWGMVT